MTRDTLTLCPACGHTLESELACSACLQLALDSASALRAPEPVREVLKASPIGVRRVTHALRCDQYAQRARAHQPTWRRGAAHYW